MSTCTDLEVGPVLGHLVRTAQASGSGTDDDDVRLGVGVHVLEVTPGHGAADLRSASIGRGVRNKIMITWYERY